MSTVLRPKDEPWPGGRGVYDWTVGGFREVTKVECAGAYVFRKAMERPSMDYERSAAGACALYGGSANWPKE